MKINQAALMQDLAKDFEEMGFAPEEQQVLIEALLEVMADNLPSLQQAVAAGNFNEIAFYAHSLKGTFNNFALPACVSLADRFAELERAAKQTADLLVIEGLMGQVFDDLKGWVG